MMLSQTAKAFYIVVSNDMRFNNLNTDVPRIEL